MLKRQRVGGLMSPGRSVAILATVFIATIWCHAGRDNDGAGLARAVLVKFYATPDGEDVKLTTGRMREFMEQLRQERQTGTIGVAFPWRIDADSKVELIKETEQVIVVRLFYVDAFNGQPCSMLFELRNQSGQWLISNHTDPAGVWWPDYLTSRSR